MNLFYRFCFVLFTFIYIYISSISGYTKSDTITLKLTPAATSNEDFYNLQNALNKKSSKYIKIVLQSGNYRINRPIVTKYDNFSIIGNTNVRISLTGGIDFLIINNNNIVVSNLTIEGNGRSAKDFYSGRAITLIGTRNVLIKGNTFSKISGIGVFLYPNGGNGCINNKIINNKFINPVFNIGNSGDEAAILLGYSGRGYFHENNIVQGNYVDGSNILKVGIGIIGHGKNNTIKDNRVLNCLSYGIIAYESQSANGTLSGTFINNNIVKNIGEIGTKKTKKGMGIYLMKSHNSFVSGNKLYNTLRNSDRSETLASGSIAISGSENVTVENNYVENSSMYGYVNSYSFNATVRNNTFKDINKSAIYLIHTRNMEISNNTFRNINEVVIKGKFGNTSNQVYKQNKLLKQYENINTGTNINIHNNFFYSPKDILYMTGEQDNKGFKGNKIKNNKFIDNTIFNIHKRVENMVNFRIEEDKSNIVSSNKQIYE